MKAEALKEWRKLRQRRRLMIAAAGLGLIGAVVAGIILFVFFRPNTVVAPTRSAPLPQVTASTAIPLNLPPPDLLRPIPPEEAMKENAERPFSGRPDTPATPFKLNADDKSRERALECLTQAVYYEAASEGADGQRAVAQVVLNRMRHPGYPASVCGVIYQGSERPTGCQFTFTCDGSLARLPIDSLWKQAQKIAAQALAGKVFGQVGHATHYHADYVLPYWADSLDKSVRVGRHIFYRLKGGLGSAGAFSQRYSGREPEPPPPSTVEVALQAIEGADPSLAAPGIDSNLQVSAGELVAPAPPQANLLADTTRGSLLLDGDTPALAKPTTPVQPTKSPACGDQQNGKQLRPLSANDLHARGAGGC